MSVISRHLKLATEMGKYLGWDEVFKSRDEEGRLVSNGKVVSYITHLT